MDTVADIVSLFLAVAMAGSAFGKLTRMKPVVESLEKAGVSPSMYPTLAGIQVVGAIGLVVGLWLEWAGVLAGFGFLLYFAGACAFHVRANDAKGMGVPAFLGVLALVVGVLRLTS